LRPSFRPFMVWTVLAATLAGVAGVTMIVGRYPSRSTTEPVVRWAATVRGARIAIWIGNIPDLINIGNLYGPEARNDVVILNRVIDGNVIPIESCEGLKQAVVDGHFEYTAASFGTAGYHWLLSDPAFRVVADDTRGASTFDLDHLRRNNAVVFQLIGQPDIDCPGQASASVG
jgi:hypothetical protein